MKEYDASQTKFIRSKMPMGKSIKMGLSSLKTKPVRLIFTILLSVISFTMFGVASALMLYNSSHTYSEALQRTDYLAEKLEKRATGKSVSQEIDGSGNVVRENKYDSSQEVLFGSAEIKKLNENNLGLVYIPIGECDSDISLRVDMEKDTDYYRRYYRIEYLSDASESDFKKLGYQLEGTYPAKDDEIILPKVFGKMLIDSKAFNKPSYTNLIGETIQVSFSKGYKNMKMVGFFDAGDVPTRYEEIKKGQESDLTEPELTKLKEELPGFFSGSFNSVVFTTSNVFEQNARKSYYSYIDTYQRSGMQISPYEDKGAEITTEYWFNTFTDQIVKENPNSFTIYDMDEKQVNTQNFSLNENEIYISQDEFNNNAYNNRRMFLNDFLNLNTGDYPDNYMRYMPTYYAFYVDNVEDISLIRDSSWMEPESAVMLYEQYKDEYKKAYKITKFIDDFMSSEYYNTNVSNANKELFANARESSVGTNTQATVNNIYSILNDNFDTACPNYLPYKYMNELYNGKESVRLKIQNDTSLQNVLQKDYKKWSDSEAQQVKTFLEENYNSGFEYKNWDYILRGYTFATFDPVPDSVFAPDKDFKFYYRDYNGNSGALTVMGYYVSNNFSYSYILNKSFVDAHTVLPQNDYHQWRSYFETNYQAPEDAKYTNVMVKTDYTQEQVEYMFRNDTPSCEYNMTSNRYMTVNFIVSMIDLLKNIFFWVGVGFGVFAALMLLNFITISVASKKKDIGILRAIGARKSDVFKIFFAESLFIGALCSLLSIIAAYVAQFFLDRYFVEQIDLSILQFGIINVGLIVVIALCISFIATIFPVIHASRKPPVESIRAL